MFVFGSVSEIFSGLNPMQLTYGVFSDEKIKGYLIDAIQLRLSEKGEDADGKKLQTDQSIRQDLGLVYSANNLKKAKQRFVDLYDSGDFYESFKIKPNKKSITVKADFEKENDNIYDNFLLTFQSFNEFEKKILSPIYDEYFIDWAENDFLEVFFEVTSEFLADSLGDMKID